jgi:PhnB protein
MSTTPIPLGYHSLQSYLTIRDAAKAMSFYCDLFGATEILRMPGPDGVALMHAELQFGDSVLMLSEESPAYGTKSTLTLGGSPVSLMHYVPDVDAIYAKAMAAGCQTIFPPSDMFWGDRFCKFVDPFGHIWGVATHISDPTPEEMEAGRKAMLAQGCKE